MKRFLVGILVIGLGAIEAAPLFALQPNAGTIMREAERQRQYFQESLSEIQVEPPAEVAVVQNSPKVMVKVIRIAGATIFKEAELLKVVEKYKGQAMTYGELEMLASKLTSYYTERGYIVKANFPPQDISEGVVIIHLVEGKLASVKTDISSSTRFSKDNASKFISYSHHAGQVVSLKNIERGTLMLNDLPGISATSTLEQGETPGYINLIVKITDTPFVQGNVDIDNYGDRSSGEYRIGSDISLNNLSGFGDQATIKILSSYYDNYVRLGYTFPFGTTGTRVSTSISYLQYELTGDFESLKASGYSYSWGSSIYYPIIRQRHTNFYAGASFDINRITDAVSSNTTNDRLIYVGSFSARGDRTDNFLSGGYSTYGLVFSLGEMDMRDVSSSIESDTKAAQANGFYSKARIFATRHQRLFGNTTLFSSINGQYALKNLDSSEKMGLGGAYGVRAYPANEASGDHGLLISMELRQDLTQRIQLAGFYDYGFTQTHANTWNGWNSTNATPNNYHLNGAGISLSYGIPGNFFLKGTVATRIGERKSYNTTAQDSDGTKRVPRYWFQMSKFF